MSKLRSNYRSNLALKASLHPYSRNKDENQVDQKRKFYLPKKNDQLTNEFSSNKMKTKMFFQEIPNIIEYLKHDLPSERSIGTDMVMVLATEQPDQQQLVHHTKMEHQFRDLLQQLTKLMFDRCENVRCGAMNALCHLSTLRSMGLLKVMATENITRSILNFLEQYFLPLNFGHTELSESAKNRKISSLDIFVDAFNLLSAICDEFVECSVELVSSQPDLLKMILLKCLKLSNSSVALNHFDITIASVEFLTVFLKTKFDCLRKFLSDCELIDCLNDLNEKLIQWINYSTSTSTGSCLYLRCLLFSISCGPKLDSTTNLALDLKKQILEQFLQLVHQIYSFPLAKNEKTLKEFIDKIQDDFSMEMKTLEEMRPLYYELKYYFQSKIFFSEWLVILASMDGRFEDEHLIEFDPLCKHFIEQTCILSLICTDLNDYVENQFHSIHLYGKHIQDLWNEYAEACLTLLNDIIDLMEFDQSQIDQIWLPIYKIVFEELTTMDDDHLLRPRFNSEIEQAALNVMRQYCLKFKTIKLSSADLDLLKQDLDVQSDLKIRIISTHLKNAAELDENEHQNQNAFNQLIQWIHFLLELMARQSALNVGHFEIFDQLMDLLSDEHFARQALRQTSADLMNRILECAQHLINAMNNQNNHNPTVQFDSPAFETVIENLEPFLNYLKNLI